MTGTPLLLTALEQVTPSTRMLLAPGGVYRRAAPFHLDLDAADRDTAIWMRHCLAVLEQPYFPIELLSLPEPLVCGQGAVVTRAGEIISESVFEFVGFQNPPEGLVPCPGGWRLAQPVTREIEQPCLLLKRPWHRNYGHWMIDSAALLALLASHCRQDGLAVVIGDAEEPAMRAVQDAVIGRLLPGAEVLRLPDHETWRFADLRFAAPVRVPPLFTLPAAVTALRAALLADAPVPARRLFVTRESARPHGRRLLNEADIRGFLIARGFEVVMPERLGVVEQAALFASARTIIGVKGAALINALFCAPGAAVMALSPADFPDAFFWDVCGIAGLRYGEVFGPTSRDRDRTANDFTIPLARIAALLDAADRAQPAGHLTGTS